MKSRPAAIANAAPPCASDSTLVEVPSRSLFVSQPFSSISAEGPWNDIIGYGFDCTNCGQLFSLSAETYHGSGGEWRPVAQI
jgi:hypothetical protein